MELDDELILFLGEVTAFEVRPQVIDPPEAAALSATEEARGLRERPPAALAVCPDVRDEPLIFFFGPCTFVCVSLLAAR